ncbi:MAG TPA: efflux RND transporter periplasmic adaptor subunit [Bacteroidota bacterium]|nr:efflux RND transporter periplasmic adaptor subunit [Bacteroidota bacterium]
MRTVSMFKIFITLIVLSFAGCGNQGNHEAEENRMDTSAGDSKNEPQSEYYTCPMHPTVVSDKPGSCPVCGMTLVKKTGSPQTSSEDIGVIQTVSLSQAQRVIANVATTAAVRRSIDREITAVGVVDYAEPRRTKVTARFRGRIEKLYVDYIGRRIERGQPLFEMYSPDLYSAEREFVLALKAMATPGADSNPDRQAMVDAARDRLSIHFGLTRDQVARIESTRTVDQTVTFFSPISGTVLGKEVQEGQYVTEGTVLYDLADLSQVWIYLDVYEKDLRFIRTDHPVRIRAESYPGETFKGRVTFIDPILEPETRTVRVRTEFDNASGKLKPQMYVRAEIHVPAAEAVVVPASAIMYTGRRNIVWVEVKENTFEPRDVRVGVTAGPMVEILDGLHEGEQVVASGGYLIESESQLRAPAQGGGLHRHDDTPGNNPPPPEEADARPQDHDGHGGTRP